MIKGLSYPDNPGKENMETYYINVPKANGVKKVDKVEEFIKLLQYGKENAIKRNDLTEKCVLAGLIGDETKDKDRAMRKLMQRAKIDYNIKITNDGKGEGYYIPTFKEYRELAKNNKREDKKAVSIFRSQKGNKQLEEDYKTERITD